MNNPKVVLVFRAPIGDEGPAVMLDNNPMVVVEEHLADDVALTRARAAAAAVDSRAARYRYELWC